MHMWAGLLDKPVCFVDSYDFEEQRYTHENPRQQPPILPDIHLNRRNTLSNRNTAANKLESKFLLRHVITLPILINTKLEQI